MSLSAELSLDIPFTDWRHETVINVIHTANRLSQVGAALFRQYDLTEAQFNLLFILKYSTGNVTQSDLGKRLVVTRASITSLVDKMEEKGLVQRLNVPGNRRIHHVTFTPKGRALVDEIEPSYRKVVHATVSGLRKEDCETLTRWLDRVREKTVQMLGEAS